MVLPEKEKNPNGELKPALRLANLIHTQDPYLDVYQYCLYPRIGDDSFDGTNVQFDYSDPPHNETIWGMGNLDHVPYSHRISFGNLVVKGRLVDPVGEIIVGLDGIVRFISQDNSFFMKPDNDYDMPPDTIVNLVEDVAMKRLISRLTDALPKEPDLLTENNNLRNPATPQTAEQLKEVIEKYSDTNKEYTSELVLGGYNYRVFTQYEYDKPKEVSVTRSRGQKRGFNRHESWKFSQDFPAEYSMYSNPEFDERKSSEIIKAQLDLIIAGMKQRSEDREIGASIAVGDDVARGVSVLTNLANSKRANYVKSPFRKNYTK